MPFKIFLLAIWVACAGCVHRIQMAPLHPNAPSLTIPRTVQAVIGPISMEGPDHRPGIALLEWSQLDLTQAILRYLQQRGTFVSVSPDPADLTMDVATKLSLTSRQNRYHYRILLRADMSEAADLIKSYRTEQTAVGSSARWVTASDRDPIQQALQAALDDLMRQIEADGPLYTSRKSD
ncbi:MAG: hypothetical protein A4E19_05735 [Nitrospira sp. SG-bin1]|nr:MAG: hypothetical protein A4E19_05735 [Nitrospira sp. SG-bin1]